MRWHMNKRRFIYITAIFAITLLTSCKNTAPPEEQKPIYPKSNSISASPIPTSNIVYDAQPKEGIFADFQGVEINTDTKKPAASVANSCYISSKSLVCYAEDIDTVFYVNYGEMRDNFLYAYKDGKSELIVEKYANHINYKDGSVYFVAGDRPIPTTPLDFYREKGIFYQYNLADQTLNKMIDTEIFNLSIYPDGFYFYIDNIVFSDSGISGSSTPVCYHLPFDSGVPEEVSPFLPIFYGEYQLAIEHYDYEAGYPGKVRLSSETNDYIILQNSDFTYTSMFIEGDKLWISTGNVNKPSITSVDLRNGMNKEYNLNHLSSYTVMDGVLFAAADGKIFRYDDEEDSFIMIIELNRQKSNIHQLSTDGKYLYVCNFSIETEKGSQLFKYKYYFTQYTFNADGSLTETELSQ